MKKIDLAKIYISQPEIDNKIQAKILKKERISYYEETETQCATRSSNARRRD